MSGNQAAEKKREPATGKSGRRGMEKKSSAAERIGRGKEEEESPEVEKLEQEEVKYEE